MSLQINGLHRVFNSAQGRGHVLRGIDLTVEPGEFDVWVAPAAEAEGVSGRFVLGSDRS